MHTTIATDLVHARRFDTPVGPLTVLARGVDQDDGSDAVIVAAGFCSAEDLWDRLPGADALSLVDADHLGPLDRPIQRYLDGEISAIDELPVAQAGTELQQEVWQGLRDIPAGQTRTYTELAKTTSKPNAVRAVGTACGRNLIAPFVPCHRALRSDGSLGGYYYGLEVKRWLLDLESRADRLPL
ncbi:MAG: methylated-DNA--[protein]-cysteine S-methyltransferase [Actinomycetota bacterium]